MTAPYFYTTSTPACGTGALPLIDWRRGEVRERVVSGRTRRETYYPAVCLDCGSERWLRKHDALKAEPCKACDSRTKGKRGFAATAKRYGQKWAVAHVQRYRLDHPSSLETAVALTLDDMGVVYQREVEIRTKATGKRQKAYLLDFVVMVDGEQRVIEVDGAFVHSQHTARDKRKSALLKRRHIPLLRLTEADIRAGRTEQMLKEFLR